jgi:peptidoglycan hydrolase-like protein with peptidoglycan-binding domain
MHDSINFSVGEGGFNRKEDVALVQLLLNGVRSLYGVPSEKLVVDGLVGPKTIGAIREFQQEYLVPGELTAADGRVDPHNATIRKLNQMAPHLPRLNNGVSFLTPHVPRPAIV